jgi:lipopolysaccharide transport system ATP-binding protein
VKETVIQVQHLSKKYRLGEIGTGALSQDIERWWKMRVMGQEDPFLKVGNTSTAGTSGSVYSLKDISFEIKQGEAVGIIGKNGAGKSTLLKLLSRVTAPTSGHIRLKGRVASMLEIGTGFHPELTGRENIYLNGAILGMNRREIDRKLDEIIDFSGVEQYIDTPVKRYSSGMYVRLAFGVAAHLESEILIIDEVLAVGDAEFQRKCLGKMGDAKTKDGRTVLFVSHNMAAVTTLCQRAILLEKGEMAFDGPAREGVEQYLQSNNPDVNQEKSWLPGEGPGDYRGQLSQVMVAPASGNIFSVSAGLRLDFRLVSRTPGLRINLAFEIITPDQILVLQHGIALADGKAVEPGNYEISVDIPGNLLNKGQYLVNVWLGGSFRPVKRFENVIGFTIEHTQIDHIMVAVPGILRPVLEYQLKFTSSGSDSPNE